MKIKLLIAFLVTVGLAFGARTTVTDTLFNPSGSRFNGSMYLTSSTSFVASDGNLVVPSQQRIQVTNGVFTVALEPNDTGVPSGTSYVVTYQLQNGLPLVENWVVPTSPTPVSLGAVRTINPPTPGFSIGLSQISLGGASSGQCLTATTSWLPSFECIYWNKYGLDAETNAVTLTAAKMLGGIINGTPTAPANYQSTTAALMVAAIPNCIVGTTYDLIVRNTSAGANTITLTTNTGITLAGTVTITQNFSRDFKIRVTNCTTSSEAITIYGLSEANGGGGGSGCVPSGTLNHILVDSGAGACNTTGVVIDGSNNITTPGTISTGSGPAACTGGTAACIVMPAGSTATPQMGEYAIQMNISTGQFEAELNGAAFKAILTSDNVITVTGKSISEAQITFTDITTGNANTSNHGYIKKLDGNAAHAFGGDGNWFTPPGGTGATAVTGPIYPFGENGSYGSILGGDTPGTQVLVDQFVAPYNTTFSTVQVALGVALPNGSAFIIGYWDKTCTTMAGYARTVGTASPVTGLITLTTNTPITQVGGTAYRRTVAQQAEAQPISVIAGVLPDPSRHYTTSSAATGTGNTYSFPATCSASGGSRTDYGIVHEAIIP